MKSLSHLNKYFFKYKYHLLLGIFFIIISNLLHIIPAQIVRYSFDLVHETIDLYHSFQNSTQQDNIYDIFINSIFIYGSLIVGIAITKGIFLFFMRQTIIVMSRHIEYDLKNEIYTHYQSLPLSFYRKNNTGDLMARISEDVSRVRMYIGPAIMYLINLTTLFLILIPIMYSINERLTLYALIPLPILSISIYFVNTVINKRSEEIQKSLSSLSTYTQEAFSGIRVLKSFVREEESVERFSEESNEYKKKSLRLTFVNSLFFPLIMALIGLSTILVVFIGGEEVIQGSISIGNIAEFVIYVNLLTWPVASLGWLTSLIQRASASQKRINEFLDTKNDIVSEKNISKPIKGKITFENVSFTYPDSGIEAIKNISFSVKPGESIGIIGSTGSGKSTIANLICRMYDTTKGCITIDDNLIKDYNVSDLRGKIGYVPQDVFLFSDTIKNNISFGYDYMNEDKIIQSSKDADVYDNISSFKEGFDTMVGERGITLSGGQKQRISIARAIIKDPEVLILDDCLSAVDTKTENKILNNLKRIMKGRTSIIISHRVSSAKLADHIIVLDEGKIIESGTHQDLISMNSLYKELYEKQTQAET